MLLDSATKFNRKIKGETIDIRESNGDGLLEISIYFEPEGGEKAEFESRDTLLAYLIPLFKKETLDKVSEMGCADDMSDNRAVALMLGDRSDLRAQVS